MSQLRRAQQSRPENAAPTPPNASQISVNSLEKLAPRRRKSRWARLITPLVIVAILMMAGGFYVRQNFNVEKIVRTQVIPQLEKQLNARVEIGSIESDYLSRVTLRGIVIGRDQKEPLGALAQIESATISLDLPALVLRRTDALGAVRGVDLQSPRVVLRRDSKGLLNWAKLWKPSSSTQKTRWFGVVTAQNGRIWYQDATLKTRNGVPLVVDAQGVSAKIEANGAAPANFQFQILRGFVGHKPQQSALRNLAFDGSADSDGKWVSLTARAPQIPAALLIEYSNSARNRLPFNARGEIGGDAQISYDTARPQSRRVLAAGSLTAREVAISLPNNAAMLPLAWRNRLQKSNETLAITHLNGPLRFDNLAFSTSGLTMQTLGADWKIAGNFAMPDTNSSQKIALFDVNANVRNLDATRLSRLIPVPESFGATTIFGGRGSGNLRISGDTRRAKIGGDFVLPNARIQNARYGDLQAREVRAKFSGDSAADAIDTRFSLPNLTARDRNGATWQSRVLDGAASWRRTNANAAQIGLKVKTSAYQARKIAFGDARGSDLDAQIVLQMTRNSGQWKARGKTVFRTEKLAAQSFANANSAALNADSAAGTLDFDGDLLGHIATLRLDLRNVAARGQQFGNGRANSARGNISWQRRGANSGANNAIPLSTDFAFTSLQARPNAILWRKIAPRNRANFGSDLRAQTLRVLVSTPNANAAFSNRNSAQWSGATQFAGFDASRVNLAALAPDVARRVRNLGVVSGRAQFAFDAKNPNSARVNGDFSLSRAQIDDEVLRDIATGVLLRDGVLRLQNARAQSDEGTLRLDAVYDVRTGRGNLGLNAPFVTVNAARINPFLRAFGVQFQGVARGNVRIATSLARGSLAPVQATFDVRIPRARLRSLPDATSANRVLESAILDATDARLRGSGVWKSSGNANWNFVGRSEITMQSAQVSGAATSQFAAISNAKNPNAKLLRLGAFTIPGWARGTRISLLKLTAQGQISQTRNGTKAVFAPQLSGNLSAERVVLPLPSSRSTATRSLVAPTFVLQSARATFVANSRRNGAPNSNTIRLQIPRWQAQIPQLRASNSTNASSKIEYSKAGATPILSGYFNVADGNFAGQILARDLDVSRAQRLADVFLPENLRRSQPALRGVLFARADVVGTLQNTRAILQTHLYRGAVAAQNRVIPLDVARATLTLSPATSQFGVREIVLWSRGGRLALSGNLAPISQILANNEYSNRAPKANNSRALSLDLSAQISNWRVRDLAQLLPKTLTQNVANQRALSKIDGALSGDLRFSGTTISPQISGRAALRLANLAGVDVPEISTQIAAQNTQNGWRVALTELRGRAEDANLTGEANLDLARKTWSARLTATDAPIERILRVAERFVPDNLGISAINSAASSTRNRAIPAPNATATPKNWNVYEAVSAAFGAQNPTNDSAKLPMLWPVFSRENHSKDKPENSANNSANFFANIANEFFGRDNTKSDSENQAMSSSNFLANATPNADSALRNSSNVATNFGQNAPRNSTEVTPETSASNTKTSASSVANSVKSVTANSSAQISPRAANDVSSDENDDLIEDRVLDNGRIPLHGTLRAVLSANGSFAPNATKNGALKPRIDEASATIISDSLSWRGRDLGALNTDISVRDSVIHINDFSLLRRLSAREIAAKQATRAIENADSEDANDSGISQKLVADNLSQVRAFGTLPLDINAANAALFNTTIAVENERFSVLRDALQEAGRILAERGLRIANLDILLNRVRALPNDLEGRMNGRAHLGGRWGALSVGLDADIDSARTSTQTLPALQTSLVFVDGEIQVNDFEIKQTFAENADGELSPEIGLVSPSDALLDGETDTKTVRETALRVAPGGRIVPNGEISLDVDVLKANLAQLAGWLPELQQVGGKSLIRGELSLFSFEVRGQTASPEVTGSIEARDISYRNYTLDRLRVAEFAIKNGLLSVEPGKLTVVKGGFQSSAAYGSVPWNWGSNGATPGPDRSGALNVHLPLQTRDFGALAGAFVPALTNVAADEFSGSIDVTGSINAPQIEGEIQLKNARFRAEPSNGPFAFGVTALGGALRFASGNRVLVDNLSGQLTRAQAVSAPATGNRPTTKPVANASVANADNSGVARAILRTLGQEANAVETQNVAAQRPDLSGVFTLNGAVDLDFNAADLVVNDAATYSSRLPLNRYDLSFTLRDGAFSSPSISGLRDISLDARWKTGDGAPQNAQNLAWKMSARGRPNLGSDKKTRGTISSSGNARLSPKFTNGFNEILRSRFAGDVQLRNLAWQIRDLGRGEIDGDLKLDNKTIIENATESAPLNRARVLPTSAQKNAQNAAKKIAIAQPNSAQILGKSSTRSSAQISDSTSLHANPLVGNATNQIDAAPANSDSANEIRANDVAKNATSFNGFVNNDSTNRATISDGAFPNRASAKKIAPNNSAISANAENRATTKSARANDADSGLFVARSRTSISDLINGIKRDSDADSAISSTRFTNSNAENAAPNTKSQTANAEITNAMSANDFVMKSQNAYSVATRAKRENSDFVAPTSRANVDVAAKNATISNSQTANAAIFGAKNAANANSIGANSSAKSAQSNANFVKPPVFNSTNANAQVAESQVARADGNLANSNSESAPKKIVDSKIANAANETSDNANAENANQKLTGTNADNAEFSTAQTANAQISANGENAANSGDGADIEYSNDANAPLRISGVLTISQTEVTGVPVGGAGVAGITPTAPNFDMRLVIGQNVRFVTPTLRAEFGGSLALSGTPRQPRLVGIVTTRNGQIRFPSASARIEDGSVEIEVVRDPLTQQLRPRATIDATARGQVGRYAITIVLRGPLDLGNASAQNLRVDVTSNPPLSQDEAFAQLTGTSLRDLDNGGTLSSNQANQAYASAVVSLLSAPLFSGIERTLEESLGLNSLTLDYRLNEPLGVELGKAIGDRIFVTYRRSLARGTLTQPSSSLRVDFRIKGGLQLGVENDNSGRNRITLEKTFRF